MANLFEHDKHSVDPRRRRRFFTLLKRVERISAVVLIWLIGVAVLYTIYNAAFLKPYFQVEIIEVQGQLKALSREEIIKETGINIGDHLLKLPVGEMQSKLAKNPWIREVAVHRKLPHMVWIYVKEFEPEGIIRLDGWYYVTKFGEVFKKLDGKDNYNFPIITGLEDLGIDVESGKFQSRVVELLNVKKLYEESSLGEIFGLSEIHFDQNKGVSITTLVDPMELRLGSGPFLEKIERLQFAYPVIRSHGGVVAYVDLSPDGKVVVKYGT